MSSVPDSATERPIKRLLIANRGEIAVRILRACRDRGIEVAVAHSMADKDSLAVELADKAICIGRGPASQSYLDVDRVLAAARGLKCDAVHPGYGFLAENAQFARETAAAGLVFIGPTPESISMLGDKAAAREAARAAGVPTLPGSAGSVTTADEAHAVASACGYPVLIKARSGGGGKGLNLVEQESDLEAALLGAAAAARASFGDDQLYLEKYVRRARHIEVQVVGDGDGHVIALGERDCTIQRSFQKLVEETPSAVLSSESRAVLLQDAVTLMRGADYRGAGTVEFLYDLDTGFHYFMEVNTRLQVEHPITEEVTGRDLVAMQLDIAQGASLADEAEVLSSVGAAIEFRINAEDPAQRFRPSAGRLTEWRPPSGPWVRIDSHCYAGYVVPPYYDSLLAKLIVTGSDREQTLARSRRALAEFRVGGVNTTIELYRWLLGQEGFARSQHTTSWLAENYQPMSEG